MTDFLSRRRQYTKALAEFRSTRDRFGMRSDVTDTAARHLRSVLDPRENLRATKELLVFFYQRSVLIDGPQGALAYRSYRELLRAAIPDADAHLATMSESTVWFDTDTGIIIGPDGPWLPPDRGQAVE